MEDRHDVPREQNRKCVANPAGVAAKKRRTPSAKRYELRDGWARSQICGDRSQIMEGTETLVMWVSSMAKFRPRLRKELPLK